MSVGCQPSRHVTRLRMLLNPPAAATRREQSKLWTDKNGLIGHPHTLQLPPALACVFIFHRRMGGDLDRRRLLRSSSRCLESLDSRRPPPPPPPPPFAKLNRSRPPGSVAEAPFQQFLLRSYRPESECFPPSDMSCVYVSRHTPLCT